MVGLKVDVEIEFVKKYGLEKLMMGGNGGIGGAVDLKG